MAKARIHKRTGDAYLAAVTMEQARALDGQDRYINGKAAKYWVRAGYVEKGEELQGMFTKKDMTPIADLTDLQCLWFVSEEGDAYRRKGAWGLGLKRYMSIVNVRWPLIGWYWYLGGCGMNRRARWVEVKRCRADKKDIQRV